LYDLLLRGDRQADQVIQADDVIFIGPVGTQVGVIGSVNEPAVFELLPGETLIDALQMAGGFNAVADRTRVAVERLSDRTAGRVSELALPAQNNAALATGDLVRAFSAITAKLPQDKQRKRVRIEGEVVRPGDYVLPAGSTIDDALQAAGGLTPAAYVFGTEFSRESVRKTQQENYDRALRDLETNLAKNQSSQRVSTADEVSAQTASASTSSRLIERLRAVRPTGRIVLEVKPSDANLPSLALEDGDQLNIPSASTSVGVFGSVFSGGSFLYTRNKSANDYLQLAGGATKGADPEGIFVLRANGSVVSSRQNDSFWSRSNGLGDTPALPGDTLFVPEEFNKSTFTQNAKDWTQILYQFGLGVAGIKAVGL
jgi:protein involved in polysaccharide export with SLBB domain